MTVEIKWADNPEKWAEFCSPDDAYHGMVFAEALAQMGNVAYLIYVRTHWLRDAGGCMSPFVVFLFLQGIETLHLRMPRHCEDALIVAKWLQTRPEVAWVNYPGLEGHTRTEIPAQRRRWYCWIWYQGRYGGRQEVY